MSAKRGQWIARRGQAGAEAAIDQVLDRQPQPGEQVQHMSDTLIEDSPYQARQPFSDDSLADLSQAMREAGFQGVLIVRPHSDNTKRRHGAYQLIYGHRRRAAWRRVCAERGDVCLVPVIVREISDERLLTIGAQENLQRRDLDPIEEAQIVAWHERMFFGKNQAEIGAMLGKSSDWVSVRSRISKLPDDLKARLRQRPRAIGQLLELGALYTQAPDTARQLAERVVSENLTVAATRALVHGALQATQTISNGREGSHNRRVDATSVHDITNAAIPHVGSTVQGREREVRHASPSAPHVTSDAEAAGSLALAADEDVALVLLQEAAVALASVAAHAERLLLTVSVEHMLEQAEQALAAIRMALARRG